MTVEEILEIVTASDYPEIPVSLNQVNGVLINKLAAISDRLQEDEITEFISIAVVLFQKAYKEEIALSELRIN